MFHLWSGLSKVTIIYTNPVKTLTIQWDTGSPKLILQQYHPFIFALNDERRWAKPEIKDNDGHGFNLVKKLDPEMNYNKLSLHKDGGILALKTTGVTGTLFIDINITPAEIQSLVDVLGQWYKYARTLP